MADVEAYVADIRAICASGSLPTEKQMYELEHKHDVRVGRGGTGPWGTWPRCWYCGASGGGGHGGLCPLGLPLLLQEEAAHG